MLLLPMAQGADLESHVGLRAILAHAAHRGQGFDVQATTVATNVQEGINMVQVLLSQPIAGRGESASGLKKYDL